VSPTGSDANNGTTPTAAFATLTRARDAVRTMNTRMTDDIVVEILDMLQQRQVGTLGKFRVNRHDERG